MSTAQGRTANIAVSVMVLLVLAGYRSAAQQSPSKADTVMKCFDKRDCLNERTTWSHLQENRPSCLTAARVWWSDMPARFPVTLVTQLSVERLDNLRAQCAFWGGPLAAALHISLVNTRPDVLDDLNKQKLQEVISLADKLFRETEAAAAAGASVGNANGTGGRGLGCQLRLVLMYEVVTEASGLQLYPVNSLRNYARLMADTDLITNIDVDMLPSASISTVLSNPAVLAEYKAGCRAGSVYVWPAFEPVCMDATYAEAVARGPCDGVGTALRGCLRTFRPTAPYSHNATDYPQWLSQVETAATAAASDKGVQAYPVTYQLLFEPWFLSWRLETLWYDYRYRGYGKNKIIHVAAMNATGVKWHVSLQGFLVHRQHAESHARRHWLRSLRCAHKEGCDPAALRGSLFQHMEALWADARNTLARQTYIPWVEKSFVACMDSLPWWRAGNDAEKGARFRKYLAVPQARKL